MPFEYWPREGEPLARLVRCSLDAFQCGGIVRPEYLKDLLLHHYEPSNAMYLGVTI